MSVVPKHCLVLYEDGWWCCFCGFYTAEDCRAEEHYRNVFYGGVTTRDVGVVTA